MLIGFFGLPSQGTKEPSLAQWRGNWGQDVPLDTRLELFCIIFELKPPGFGAENLYSWSQEQSLPRIFAQTVIFLKGRLLTRPSRKYHNPPWIENDERIRTSTCISAHIKGIQVDIFKSPAL